jgi:hypothetical protein
MKQLSLIILFCALCCCAPAHVLAFYSNGRWSTTALNGWTGAYGTGVDVTWGLVPDGTFIPGEGGSNLIAFMDGLFGNGGGGTNYQNRPWFHFFEDSFDRWSELGGLTFHYEDDDDGSNLRNLYGLQNVRGDVRIGGANIDGVSGTLASTSFLLDADLTIDTADSAYYSNSFNDYQNMRNTLMHEIGHALGLGHIDSTTTIFLMEPNANAAPVVGPQLDEIRGLHYLYGDVNEKGAGNNTAATATPLNVTPGVEFILGKDPTVGNIITQMAETDFLSISNQSDFDYFTFEIARAAVIDLSVFPVGQSYNERISFSGANYSTTFPVAIGDLGLQLYSLESGSPVLLSSQDVNPIGNQESIAQFLLETPGEYAFRISASTTSVQLYQFSLLLEYVTDPNAMPGDFDGDGDVDGRDFLLWQQGGSIDPLSSEDLQEWQTYYSGSIEDFAASYAVPEPTAWGLMLTPLLWGVYRRGVS